MKFYSLNIANSRLFTKWQAMLKSPDSKKRLAAIVAIGLLGSKAKSSLPQLLKSSVAAGPSLDCHIIWALGEIGSPTPQCIETLKKYVRGRKCLPLSLRVLGQLDSIRGSPIPEITKLLSDPDWTIRIEACRTLGAYGKRAKAANQQLKLVLENDKELAVRIECAVALYRSTGSRQGLPVLMRAMDIGTFDVSFINRISRVSLALSKFGTAGAEALPKLNALIKKFSRLPGLTIYLKFARAKIRNEDYLGVLAAALKRQNMTERLAALRIAQEMGKSARKLSPLIRQIMFKAFVAADGSYLPQVSYDSLRAVNRKMFDFVLPGLARKLNP